MISAASCWLIKSAGGSIIPGAPQLSCMKNCVPNDVVDTLSEGDGTSPRRFNILFASDPDERPFADDTLFDCVKHAEAGGCAPASPPFVAWRLEHHSAKTSSHQRSHRRTGDDGNRLGESVLVHNVEFHDAFG